MAKKSLPNNISADKFKVYRERFWSYVDKSGGEDACWFWQGRLPSTGYGQFWFAGKLWRAHRLSYFFTTGIKSELYILHNCNNRSCVNPSHLREGTQADNMEDRRKSGYVHQTKGRKLSATQVREIKLALLDGISNTVLGRRFGVDRTSIRAIKQGRCWRHVKI